MTLAYSLRSNIRSRSALWFSLWLKTPPSVRPKEGEARKTTDILIEFLTKDIISRTQLYPFFKGIYKLCPPLRTPPYLKVFIYFILSSKVLQYKLYYRITKRLYNFLLIIWLLSLLYFPIRIPHPTQLWS